MNAVIASPTYSPSKHIASPPGKIVLTKPVRGEEIVQRPVRMRHQSLNEATAVLTYSNNAGTVYDNQSSGLDLYA